MDCAFAERIGVIEQAVVAMTVVDPTRMIDDGVQRHTVQLAAAIEGRDALARHVLQPIDASVSLGKDGGKLNAGGEVFAGGKAEASVSQEVGPVDVGVGGEVSYGIGAHADIDAEVSTDHVGIDFDIGATLGLGGGVKVDVGFDPTFWN